MTIEECLKYLELEPTASLEDAKRAYEELTEVWQPARVGLTPQLKHRAEEKTKAITIAYYTLCLHFSETSASSEQRQEMQGATTDRVVDTSGIGKCLISEEDNPTEEELRLFVGPKAESYIKVWHKMNTKSFYTGNVAAFLLPLSWLVYRKMYGYAWLMVSVSVMTTILGAEVPEHLHAFFLLIWFGAWITFICFANSLYYRHAKGIIIKARMHSHSREAAHIEIARKGGVNLTGAVLVGIPVFVCGVANLISAFK